MLNGVNSLFLAIYTTFRLGRYRLSQSPKEGLSNNLMRIILLKNNSHKFKI